MTTWNRYPEYKPEKEGVYLWARNNWNATRLDGSRFHQYSVRLGRWTGISWVDYTANQGLMDPDQWAEVPMPEPAKLEQEA